MRRSGEQNSKTPWTPNEICVCTPAMLLNAIKFKFVDMSQQALIIMDEVHEANSALSPYGQLLPCILKCTASQRPRVIGLSASPSSSKTSDIRESISSLCDKLLAVPYTPYDYQNETAKSVNCEYVGIQQTMFELKYKEFVIELLEKLSGCHSFFKSNWRSITELNVSTQIKVDIVVKTLSHAEHVAQDLGDRSLFELTQWMRKWIDSLDLLQIFGPRKLIEFIRSDLEFTQRNDCLQKISPTIGVLFSEMQASIDVLVSENGADDNSPKVDELIRRLTAHQHDDERILVFVNRRKTAERLCRKLKGESDVAAMNPLHIVGNSGSNLPKEQQQSVLEKFSKGECRVLISEYR